MSTEVMALQLADLKKRVETLEAAVRAKPKNSWREALGYAKNDDLFDEAMKLGAEWRAKANQEGK